SLWRSRPAARATTMLSVLGFNAAAYLLWPLGFVRPLIGSRQDPKELAEYASTFKFPSAEVIFGLKAAYANMVNFFDKLLTGTAVHHAYVLMLLYLWALLLWLDDERYDALVLAAAASAGMLFFHGVVGLSV